MKWDASLYQQSFSYVTAHGAPLVDMLDPRPGEHILDLGCGTGELTAVIAARGAVASGLDASAEMVERAKERFPHLDFVVSDAHNFTRTNPVDAVFSNAALHWMTRPDEVLDSVRGILRPAGRFVAEMGGAGNCASLIEGLARAAAVLGMLVDSPLPWYFPSPAEYATRLERAGFRLRLLQYIDRPTPLHNCPGGAADWWRMMGPAVLSYYPVDRVDELLAELNRVTEPTMCRPDAVWVADYVRLRFIAEVA